MCWLIQGIIKLSTIEINSVVYKSISEFKHTVDIATYFDVSELDLISVTDEVTITGTKYK